MSAIPPNANVIGSILQSGVQQNEQARQTDAEKNAQLDRARQTGGGPADVMEVEETDADTRVDADSAGQGSQGRHDAPPEEEAEEQTAREGITVDDQGKPHIDLSA